MPVTERSETSWRTFSPPPDAPTSTGIFRSVTIRFHGQARFDLCKAYDVSVGLQEYADDPDYRRRSSPLLNSGTKQKPLGVGFVSSLNKNAGTPNKVGNNCQLMVEFAA